MPFLTHPDRKENIGELARSWSISTTGNLVGSVAMAAAASTLIFTTDPCMAFAAAIALKKTASPFAVLFFKVRAVSTLEHAAERARGWCPLHCRRAGLACLSR